jgi:hypothetical protein
MFQFFVFKLFSWDHNYVTDKTYILPEIFNLPQMALRQIHLLTKSYGFVTLPKFNDGNPIKAYTPHLYAFCSILTPCAGICSVCLRCNLPWLLLPPGF